MASATSPLITEILPVDPLISIIPPEEIFPATAILSPESVAPVKEPRRFKLPIVAVPLIVALPVILTSVATFTELNVASPIVLILALVTESQVRVTTNSASIAELKFGETISPFA